MGREKPKRPTSYDVAKLAGVSQATVSLVLNDKGTTLGISQETAEKVRAAAQQLRYYPNSLIRSVQRGRSGIIGVYGQDHRWSTRHSYWIEALGNLHTSAAELEVELLIFSDHPSMSRARLLERMLSGFCDGIVVQPGEENSILDDLVAARLPIVAIGDPFPGVPSVAIDSSGGILALVQHLASKGHQNFAMINLEHAHFGSPRDREQAYLSATRDLGLNAPTEAIFHVHSTGISDTIDRIMKMDPRPTAVVCFNDEWAYNSVRVCLERGIRVPQDLAITGFDGIPVPLVPLQATTVRSPIDRMCRLALENLLCLVRGEGMPENAVLPVELVQGETT